LRRAAAADDESRHRIASLQAEVAAERAEVERQCGIVARLNAEAVATAASHERQLASLREEIRGYRGAVAQLDRHIQDNVPVRLLQDELAQLKDQNEALQGQLRKANTSLSTVRVEATAMEGMRVSSLQGLVKDYQRRISHLEKEQRFGRPLIKDLAAAARRHGSLDVALERDVELFTRQFVAAAGPNAAGDDHPHSSTKPLLLA
jgi:chromosome segregation ATPase